MSSRVVRSQAQGGCKVGTLVRAGSRSVPIAWRLTIFQDPTVAEVTMYNAIGVSPYCSR
jgi:hypothetical protein